jgi:hypothetical protein
VLAGNDKVMWFVGGADRFCAGGNYNEGDDIMW